MLRATFFVKNAQGVWNVVYGSSPTSFRSALRIVKLFSIPFHLLLNFMILSMNISSLILPSMNP